MTEHYLSRKQASIYLHEIGCPVSPQRLAIYAMQENARNGPSFIKIKGFMVRYAKTDLESWARANTKFVR